MKMETYEHEIEIPVQHRKNEKLMKYIRDLGGKIVGSIFAYLPNEMMKREDVRKNLEDIYKCKINNLVKGSEA